jgi:hypothetical protein
VSKHKSTPGKRAHLYLQTHRDARYSNLPDAQRESREQLLGGLEREDPGVRDRALVGSAQHFDQPLSKGERAYQQHWQGEEGLDVGDVTRKRKELDRDPSVPTNPGRRPGAGGRRTSSGGRRRSSRAITRNAPAAATDVAGMFWDFLMAGIAISVLYLVLTSSNKKGGTNVLLDSLSGFTGAFARLADPTNNLFGPASKSAAAATPAPSGTGGGAPLKGGLAPIIKKPSKATKAAVFGAALPNYSAVTPTIP